ncbi:MAG: sigma-54-dependent Fis family transcriptional regulator [Pirellulales bacterium]
MPAAFLDGALERIAVLLGLDYVAIARGVEGEWATTARSGRTRPLPIELLSEVVDKEAARSSGRWTAVPLDPRQAPGELLVVAAAAPPPVETLKLVATTLFTAVVASRESTYAKRRVERLEAILSITARWNRAGKLDELLKEMAEAAARLLGAERASLFLWDERSRELVGRPALGIPGGELRVPDNQGVVGQILKTGLPVRVAERDKSAAINRRVDQKLGFRTRNLVGVPLVGSGGQRFGVFEVLNRDEGDFNADDESALTELASHAVAAIETSRQFQRLVDARTQVVEEAAGGLRLLGECRAIQQLRKTLARVAATDLSVLVLGENGTGKEVVSRLVHYGSSRRDEPLVAVNCAALPESLLESELFGHERGAFTDARDARAGKFELAAHGTLFLDEIGDMSLGGQAKLLRVLEDKLVTRVGGSTPRPTDTRVIAATNQDLVELVRARKFREDLYFRLNVVTLELPPLRARGEDVWALAEHFLEEFSGKARREPPRFTPAASKLLLTHPWPGNVRELRNLVERLVFLCPEDEIDRDDLAALLSPLTRPLAGHPIAPSTHGTSAGRSDANALSSVSPSADASLAEATASFQEHWIRAKIAECDGNMTIAAERLGLDRANLYRKMKQLGMRE